MNPDDKFGLAIPKIPLVGIGRAIDEPAPTPAPRELKTYDPKSVTFSFNGVVLKAFDIAETTNTVQQSLDTHWDGWDHIVASALFYCSKLPSRRQRIRAAARARKLHRGWA